MDDLDIEQAWSLAAVQLEKPAVNVFAAWQTAMASLNPRTLQLQTRYDPPVAVTNAVQNLAMSGMKDDLYHAYLASIKSAFSLVQADIVAHLDEFEAVKPEDRPLVIEKLLHKIGLWIHTWQQPITVLWSRSSQALSGYRRCFLSALYESLPPSFSPVLSSYIRHLFHNAPVPNPSLPLAMPTLISLLDRYDPLLFGLIYEEIEKKVQRECKADFEQPKLKSLLSWVNGDVLAWVSRVYERNMDGGLEDAKKILKPTFSRFEYHIHKTLVLLRSTELFDIILNYPASLPALEDIKTCLLKTDQRGHIVTQLRALNDRRLLHPGVDTKDIITQYIATIRCLRVVDPPGVLLSRVADPIRQYLRTREDTIRCIVSRLMEEESALAEEFAASDARPVQDARDEAENYNDPKWTPDPVDAPPDFRKNKGSDVIQMLVSIYDTKDVFIKELQVLLAQRLLAIRDYAIEKDLKNVEIFKLRFGEASLAGCEVMIKDMQDSKRIDTSVHDRNQGVPLHATIVSRLFWPSFQPAPLKLPGQLGRAQYEYDKAFVHLKPDKKLRWLPQLGTVNITIALKDRSITLDVSPLQASLIELFSQQDTWATDDLAIELRLTDLTAVRNGLYFWNNLGVLKSLPDDTWQLLEVKDSVTQQAASHVIEEEAAAVQSVESQQIEQMRVFWQYIKGMLTNLGALPLARIHATLNMLVPTYKGRTTDELVAFLDAMAAEGLVEKTAAGSWKIVK